MNYPILYKADETEFGHMGEGILADAISCIVTEVSNGEYELAMKYPMKGIRSEKLDYDMIIKAKANEEHGPQLFRIYAIDQDISGHKSIKAQHIFYDLLDNFIEGFSLLDATCTQAGTAMLSNCAFPTPFTFEMSDITHTGNYSVERVNPIQAIAGVKGSLLDTYGSGATITRDNYKIGLMQNKIAKSEILIAYRKNMTGFKRSLDGSTVATKLYPYAKVNEAQGEDGKTEEKLITLGEKYLVNPYLGNYAHPKILPYDFSGDDVLTEEDLRKKASNYFTEDRGLPKITYTVSFIPLSKTLEYKDYQLLETVVIGTDVTVFDERFNLRISTKVIKTVYDSLAGRYTSIDLGTQKASLATNKIESEQTTENKFNQTNNNMTILNNALVDAIKNATDRITGADGGYVVLNPKEDPQEILILDHPEIDKAVNVWRFNKGGLGHSKNGYNGPFELAMTADGQIVANKITTGELNALIIKAGAIMSASGNVALSIDENYFQVNHTNSHTKTRIDAEGFYILDENDEILASLSGKDSWTELKADKVFANNIENIYDGDSNLYVDHSFTGECKGTQSNPFNSFIQLATHLQSACIINKDINIYILTTRSEITESLTLYGLKGSGVISIIYDGNCVHRTGANGSWCLRFVSIYNAISIRGNRSRYDADDGAILCDTGNAHGMSFIDCRNVNVGYININCKNWGIKAVRSNVRGEKIDFCDTYCAYDISEHSICSDSDGVGNCADFFRLYSGSVFTYGDSGGGYRPKGNRIETSGKYFLIGSERSETGSFRTKPPVPPTSNYEKSFSHTSLATYQYKWGNWKSGECKQGVWDIYGNKAGHIFFDVSAIRSFIGSGTILDGSTITIKRRNAGGYSSATNIYLNASSASSASGTPSYSNNTLIGSLAWNQSGTFTLPKAIVQAIKNGTANSLALYSSSNSSAYFEAVSCSINIKVNK